ncbi:glycosyltransferase [Catenulispora sp. NF23]|uniref:glycosyltransferase family 2 protein n=1 Tax=Catenulispora pinistramenti TaxID=2705254 RepID=UPI001BAC4E71|nr:glycosyltransferase [Catenulispora pinistramenti]MBS2538803.1 glycosyltransferase [Catenulispora pinistramenti]
MNVLSIITAIYNPDAGQLREAYDSIRAQVMPDGWELEWVVQEDGRTGIAEEILSSDDPLIAFGSGRQNGVAITRNLALARARGTLVKNLDQDDVLTKGVVMRDIEVLVSNPDVGWTTSRVLDLLPDGSTLGFDNDPPAGRLEPGVVLHHWRKHNFRLPVHPTTMCLRRELLTAVGGWMAVPGSDDTGALVAASILSPGWFREEVGLLYRKWPGQESAGGAHTEPVEWNARMSLINERAEALAALGKR